MITREKHKPIKQKLRILKIRKEVLLIIQRTKDEINYIKELQEELENDRRDLNCWRKIGGINSHYIMHHINLEIEKFENSIHSIEEDIRLRFEELTEENALKLKKCIK